MTVIYRGGHSNYSQPHFIRMVNNWMEYAWLAGAKFDGAAIVDVRTYPNSRNNPQFCQDDMREWLPRETRGHVEYLHEPRLGGRRCRKTEKNGMKPYPLPDSVNRGFESDAFVSVADYANVEPHFMAALDDILTLAQTRLVMVMCSEATAYWASKMPGHESYHCHTQIIADHAVMLRGAAVMHVRKSGRFTPHQVTRFARVTPDHQHVIYPKAEATSYA